MSYFITADYHILDPRMKILGRPFSSPEEMLEVLVKNCNEMVKPNDTLIVVGDVCNKEHPEGVKSVARFNGKKILIRGNHDVSLKDEDLKKYFEKVIPDGDGMVLKIGDLKCHAVHYPTRGKQDMFCLTAHIHSAWKYQLNMFNIGIDTNHFYPVALSTIPDHLKAIEEFYDDDVWCAYNKINAQFVGKRGKKGSYFKETK